MYEADRLSTDVWVSAHLRQCSLKGIPAYVVHKGAAQSGTILLKINQGDAGCQVLTQVRDADGILCWMPAHDAPLISEKEADTHIQGEIKMDPDVWVIEIEDLSGHNPFEGKVLE